MVSLNVRALFKNLRQDANGIWRSANNTEISYPTSGNDICFDLEDRSFWFRHRNNCIVETVRRFPPEGEILDIGGGNGFVAKRLIDEGFPTILIEPGANGANNAKTRRLLPYVICASLQEINLPDASVPAFGCFDVLEHIRDDASFLEEIARILKSSGMLYLTVPARQSLWSSSDTYAGHFRRYDTNNLNLLLRSKFKILYSTFIFGILTIPLFCLKTIPYNLGYIKKENILSNSVEHGINGGIFINIISNYLNNEVKMITKKRAKRFGTSLLIAAKRF